MLLALFDIDGTLISTDGVGMQAFYRAIRSVLGVQAEEGAVRPDGKTDPLIFRELTAYLGLQGRISEETRDAVFSAYLSYLEEGMRVARERGKLRILPGVKELLDRLAAETGFRVGLVTGNLQKGALIKLKAAGLAHYFGFGGYGSDSEDRTMLTRIAIRRGCEILHPMKMDAAFVIGDTPLDIQHGRAAGALTIAVASSNYSMEKLADHGPDLLLPDLCQASELIEFMKRWISRAPDHAPKPWEAGGTV